MSPEQAEWSGVRGDYWHRRWVRMTGSSTLADPVVEIRNGPQETAPLVASSVVARQLAEVAAIDLSATDLGSGILDWVILATESVKIAPAATYRIEVEVKRDGHEATIMSHAWQVLPQVAVRP